MSRQTHANSAPAVLTTTHSGEAKFPPSYSSPSITTQLTPPQPALEVDTTTLHQNLLSDTQDRLDHALSQLAAAQAALQSARQRPAPRAPNEKDALIKRLTHELARKEATNQSLRRDLVIAERKLNAAFANHDEYRRLGTRALRRLLRDQAELEGEIIRLRGRNRELRGELRSGEEEEEEEGEEDGDEDSMFEEVEDMF